MQDDGKSFEYIPISHLNAYAYCPRRFYYEFALGEMVVNEHVLEGQQLHEQVDTPGSRARDEKYKCAASTYARHGWGWLAYCDLLEVETHHWRCLWQQQKTARSTRWSTKRAKWGNGSPITSNCAPRLWHWRKYCSLKQAASQHGYVFYIGSARRDEVVIDETLRRNAARPHRGTPHCTINMPPPPITNWRKCRDCSLEPLCLPREVMTLQT